MYRSNLAELFFSLLSSALLAFLRLFFHFDKLIRCGGTACLENDCITLVFSGSCLRHLNVAYIDDTTQPTHFVKKSGHVMVWSSDFYLEWDLGVEIPVHLFLWLKQQKFQAGLGAEIGNAAQ